MAEDGDDCFEEEVLFCRQMDQLEPGNVKGGFLECLPEEVFEPEISRDQSRIVDEEPPVSTDDGCKKKASAVHQLTFETYLSYAELVLQYPGWHLTVKDCNGVEILLDEQRFLRDESPHIFPIELHFQAPSPVSNSNPVRSCDLGAASSSSASSSTCVPRGCASASSGESSLRDELSKILALSLAEDRQRKNQQAAEEQ